MYMYVFTNLCSIIYCAKDEFGSAVVAAADVRNIRLALDQVLGAAKVTQLQHARLRVEQQVLRLDIPVTDAQ